MLIVRSVLIVCLALLAHQGMAQDRAPVLHGNQVTESALIDALTVQGPAGPAEGAMRGFGVVGPTASQRVIHPGPGKANLVMTFAVDSAELTSDSIQTLDTVAKALQSDQLAGFSFSIEGHADPRGGDDYNRQLSERRAAAVVGNLVQRHGILPERLKAVGKGSTELLDYRHPNAEINRRVTIVTDRG